jgi:hypothetical protein
MSVSVQTTGVMTSVTGNANVVAARALQTGHPPEESGSSAGLPFSSIEMRFKPSGVQMMKELEGPAASALAKARAALPAKGIGSMTAAIIAWNTKLMTTNMPIALSRRKLRF